MSPRARWWTFGIVCAALFMAMLDNLVVLTALPAIRAALHAGVGDLEWTVNAYTLAFAVLMLTGAALGDRFGHKRIFLAGVALFTLGSGMAAVSDSAPHLLVARAVQGVGAAFLSPLTLTLLARAFPPEQRAAAIGLWAGISGLGLAIGPLVGGAIVNGIAWNAIFWLNVPTGVLVLALGWLRLDESFGRADRIDLPGLALAGGGLFGVTYALIRGNALGWGSDPIIAGLIGGSLLLAAFLVWERRTARPMLDLGMFAIRGFSVPNGVGFLMGAGMFGSIFLLTLYVQEIQHYSPFSAGLRTMPWTGTIMVVAPLAGLLAARVGTRLPVIAGMSMQTVSLLWIASLAEPATPYLQLLPAFILGGIGMGLSFAPLSTTVMNAVDRSREGQASGAYNAVRELGGVFGVAILGAVFQHLATAPTSAAFMDGFRAALYAGAGVVALGTVAALLMPGVRATASPAFESVPEVA